MTISVQQVGSGDPAVAVLCGVHGDERSSLLIQNILASRGVPEGTLHLVGPVNQAAWRAGQRYIDEDLNRTFPDPDGSTYEGGVASDLLDIVKPMDLVIDIHTFRMTTQLTVIPPGGKDLVKYFGPDMIWQIDPSKDHDKEFEHTLGLNLALNGTDNFVIELPPVEEIDEAMVDRCVTGIYNVITKEHPPREDIPEYTRYKHAAPAKGIFVPHTPIMTWVEEGDVVGRLFSSPTSSTDITASQDGKLLQRRHQSWIETGETVYAVGRQVS